MQKLKNTDEKNKINKWRDEPCSWIGRFDIFSISCFPNFNAILLKNASKIFVDMNNLIDI